MKTRRFPLVVLLFLVSSSLTVFLDAEEVELDDSLFSDRVMTSITMLEVHLPQGVYSSAWLDSLRCLRTPLENGLVEYENQLVFHLDFNDLKKPIFFKKPPVVGKYKRNPKTEMIVLDSPDIVSDYINSIIKKTCDESHVPSNWPCEWMSHEIGPISIGSDIPSHNKTSRTLFRSKRIESGGRQYIAGTFYVDDIKEELLVGALLSGKGCGVMVLDEEDKLLTICSTIFVGQVKDEDEKEFPFFYSQSVCSQPEYHDGPIPCLDHPVVEEYFKAYANLQVTFAPVPDNVPNTHAPSWLKSAMLSVQSRFVGTMTAFERRTNPFSGLKDWITINSYYFDDAWTETKKDLFQIQVAVEEGWKETKKDLKKDLFQIQIAGEEGWKETKKDLFERVPDKIAEEINIKIRPVIKSDFAYQIQDNHGISITEFSVSREMVKDAVSFSVESAIGLTPIGGAYQICRITGDVVAMGHMATEGGFDAVVKQLPYTLTKAYGFLPGPLGVYVENSLVGILDESETNLKLKQEQERLRKEQEEWARNNDPNNDPKFWESGDLFPEKKEAKDDDFHPPPGPPIPFPDPEPRRREIINRIKELEEKERIKLQIVELSDEDLENYISKERVGETDRILETDYGDGQKVFSEVGGVLFQGTATPPDSLKNKSISLSYQFVGDHNATLTVSFGEGRQSITATSDIPAWVWAVAARFADSKYTAVMSLISKPSTNDEIKFARSDPKGNIVWASYHPAVDDTLIGTFALFADCVFGHVDIVTGVVERIDNIKEITGYDFETDQDVALEIARQFGKMLRESGTHVLMLNDVDTKYSFKIQRKKLQIRGYPTFHFVRRMGNGTVQPLIHINEYADKNRALLYDVNPYIFRAVEDFAQISAFFRYVKQTDPVEYARFLRSLDPVFERIPKMKTPAAIRR